MYFVLNIFILLLSFFLRGSNKEYNRKVYITILTIVMVLLSGLRHENVGSDTDAYLFQFDNSMAESWSDIFSVFFNAYFNPSAGVGKDPAMWVLNKLIALFSTNHCFFLLITSSMLLIPLGVFFYKNTNTIFEIAFAYVFFNTLYYSFIPNSAIRQSIAIGFALMAYVTLSKKRLFVPITLLLMGTFFHKSALLVLLFFGVIKVFKPNDFYKLSIISIILVLLFYREIGMLMADTNDIYSKYGYGSLFTQGGRPIIIVLFTIGLYIIGLLKVQSFTKEEMKDHRIAYPIIGAALTVTFIPLVRLDSTLIRISAYFVVWLCLFIPKVLERFNPSVRNILLVGIVGLLLYRSYVEPQQYAFFWQTFNLVE